MTGKAAVYPLTGPGILTGLIAGGLFTVLFDFPMGGLSVAVLCAGVGLTWRRGEIPILPFVIFYQWVSVSIGMLWERWVGPLHDLYQPGDLEGAVLYGLTGLLVLATGMRVGAGRGVPVQSSGSVEPQVVVRLFWIVIGLFATDYLYVLDPKIYFGADVIIEKVMAFRYVLLIALWILVLAGRGHRVYLAASFVWVFIPSFVGYYSGFKTPIFLLCLAYATYWEPWRMDWWRRASFRSVMLAPAAAVVLFLAVLWQGGVKQETRRAYDRGEVGASSSDRIELVAESAQGTLPAVMSDFEAAVADVVARLSYVTFFSRVLAHTPVVEPHAEGELLWMAVVNGTVPRFLYPEKQALPSDSVYTRRFAGILLQEQQDAQTSVSIGYMAEFYADWGVGGMFASVLAYGFWMGLLHRGLRRLIRTPLLVPGALVTVFLACITFEHQFVKGFGALNMGFAVTILLATLSTLILRRILSPDPARPGARVESWSRTAADVPGGRS